MKFKFIIAALLLSNIIIAQEIPSMNLAELKEHIYQDNDVTYVVNFWATWCAPCIRELPYFEEFNKKHDPEKVKVILVSLDFESAKEKRLIPFLKKKKIHSEVIHFAEEMSPNYWIPEFSEIWTGSIPATLILNGKQGVNAFFEQSFDSAKELDNLYRRLIK